MLVKKVEIAQLMPCIADPAKIRVIALFPLRINTGVRGIHWSLCSNLRDMKYRSNDKRIKEKR